MLIEMWNTQEEGCNVKICKNMQNTIINLYFTLVSDYHTCANSSVENWILTHVNHTCKISKCTNFFVILTPAVLVLE